jgi:prophage tail gpP-like protein/phage tail protein X
LSITYKIAAGDTFESIARKKYGSELYASQIASANPGLAEPLTEGTTINVPDLPNAPKNILQQIPAQNQNETAILIDGERFRFWDKMRLTKSIDQIDTIEIGAPFEAELPNFRQIFKPFSFKSCEITVGGQSFFTGTLVGVNPVIENLQKIVSVSGYSKPGVLHDCTPPASSFPIEFNDQNLQNISGALAASFGVSVVFDANQGSIFERVAIEPGQKIMGFLSKLAKQRNLVITSTSDGALLFWRSIETGTPVARLTQGASPVLSVSPFFSPQEFYSHITGIEPSIVGLAGSQYTVKNPKLESPLRPFTFMAPDTLDSDLKEVVQAKVSRMYGNMASYLVRVASWRDPLGELWQPNTLVTLQAPDAMVYNAYTFLIRSVEFEKESNLETANLNLVIPESFNGQIPEALPWDE